MNHYYFLKFVWQFSIVYDLFFSFVFGLCLYLSLCLCLDSIFLTLTQSHYWHYKYFALPIKTFLNFTLFFFYHLSLLLPNYQSTKNKQSNTTLIYSLISTISILSLYLSYLYNIRERVTNTEWQRVTKPKSPHKKKKNTTGSQAQIQFITTESPIQYIIHQ